MNRVADVLLEPLFLVFVALAVAFALRYRRPKIARRIPPVAGVALFVFALPGVANRLQRANEQPVLTSIRPDVTYDAVIVLGGTMNGGATFDSGQPSFNDAVERVLTTFDLLRTGRARFAIVSGTSWPYDAAIDPKSEARLVADQLEAWGIDPSRLVLDEVSRTTHENAIDATRIAREHGWTRDLLVTSAAHMSRARGCFAREGLAVDTLAVDFGAYDSSRRGSGWIPRAGALAESTGAMRERVGRWIYRLRGWSE